ncbi:uncharacterized protein LOC117519006 [Thalassophryne amazonica]|uniref:uncharacterized protein LOC117519006 n=1 Tax=Thalassophryne amazonica TaxID=390379 RepID=UPI0014708BBE|nr:uncharacterized protein LOC117519006 [Thalassophryne amazonica]
MGEEVLKGLVVLVHYAITLEVDSGGISSDTLNFITLHNNLLEKTDPTAPEDPTVVNTITDFRNYFITEAQKKDDFLINSSVSTEASPLQLENAENMLPSRIPTSQPDTTYDNMDNVLASEKPPDAPSHEGDGSDEFSKTEDFLFDPFDTWKGQQSKTSSKNDVFMFEESNTPPVVAGYLEKTSDSKPGKQGYFGNNEGEGFFFSNAPDVRADTPRGGRAVRPGASTSSPVKPQPSPDPEVTLDDGSGSAGDGQADDLWTRRPTLTPGEGDGSLEVPPPPAMERTEEDDGNEEELQARDGNFIPVMVEPTHAASLEMTTEPPFVDLKEEEIIDEPYLDWVLVTPNVGTDLLQKTTTQAPVFSSAGTVMVELSVQTAATPSVYDDVYSVASHTVTTLITNSPQTGAWTNKTPVFAKLTEAATESREITDKLPQMENTTEAGVSVSVVTLSPTAKEPETEIKNISEPEVHKVSDTNTSQGASYHYPSAISHHYGSDIDLQTKEPPEIQTFTEKPKLLSPESVLHGDVEIFEEQHIDIPDATTTSLPDDEVPDEDLTVDEVMVIAPTTAAPIHCPEDEEPIHQEEKYREDISSSIPSSLCLI